MDKRLIAILLVLSLLPLAAPQALQHEPHGRLVVVIVMDAYSPIYDANMSSLNALAEEYGYSVPLEVQYPAVTIVSHMVFVTGMYPNETHIVNTYMYDPDKLRSDRTNAGDALISRSYILEKYNITTLYTEAYKEGYLTALVTAKSKLIELLGSEGKATIVAQYPYSYDLSSLSDMLQVNERLMNKTKEIVSSRIDKIYAGERAYVLVNLPGTDYIGHNYGVTSDEYKEILMQEQQLVVDFINRLKSTSIRSKSLVIVCGDHAMADVSVNVATQDTITQQYIIPELAVAGVTHVAIGSSGMGVLVYLLHNDSQTMEEAVQALRNTGKVDGIRTALPVDGANGTLADIGLNTPYAGDIFVSLKPPYYFSTGDMKGAHGGYSTKLTRARIITGRKDALKAVNKLTSVDIAALSFGFLGLEPMGHAKPEKVLKDFVISSIEVSLPPFLAAGEEFKVIVDVNVPEGFSGELSVSIYDSNGKLVVSKSVSVSGSGTYVVSFSGLSEGSYYVEVSLLYGGHEVAGKSLSVVVQQPVATEVKQPVSKMAIAAILLVLIIIFSLYLPKRLKRVF